MDKSEASTLKDSGGRMRPREPHAQPLPWGSLAEVHAAEIQTGFAWTPETEEAFFLLLAKGYSIGRITSQNAPGWPTYADYLKKRTQDPDFLQKCKNQNFNRAESLVDFAGMQADISRPATASADKLRIDTAFRTAAALDPDRFGQRSSVGISGGLVLASGDLAELAAQAALLHTKLVDSVTQSAQEGIEPPNNIQHSELNE